MVIGLSLFTLGMTVTAASGVFLGALVGFAAVGLAAPTFNLAAQSYVSIGFLPPPGAGAVGDGDHLVARAIARGTGCRLAHRPPRLAGALWCWRAGAAAVMTVRWALDRDTPAPMGTTSSLKLDRKAVNVAVMALFMGGSRSVRGLRAWLGTGSVSLLALGAVSSVVGLSELTGSRLPSPSRTVWEAALDRAGAGGGDRRVPDPAAEHAVGIGVLAVALLGFEFSIVSWIPLATEVRPLARPRFLAVASLVAPWPGQAPRSARRCTQGSVWRNAVASASSTPPPSPCSSASVTKTRRGE